MYLYFYLIESTWSYFTFIINNLNIYFLIDIGFHNFAVSFIVTFAFNAFDISSYVGNPYVLLFISDICSSGIINFLAAKWAGGFFVVNFAFLQYGSGWLSIIFVVIGICGLLYINFGLLFDCGEWGFIGSLALKNGFDSVSTLLSFGVVGAGSVCWIGGNIISLFSSFSSSSIFILPSILIFCKNDNSFLNTVGQQVSIRVNLKSCLSFHIFWSLFNAPVP